MYAVQTIYRFEYEDGSGIYTGDRCVRLFDFDHRHPTPDNDSGLAPSIGEMWTISDYHFGFLSLEQLRSWFYNDNHLVGLHNKGVVIVEYECHPTDVLEGHTQAMFIRGKSYGKEQFSILEYFNLEKSA